MNEATVLALGVKAMMLVLVLSMPPILLATITGILLSLVQALTQIQEQTLAFAVKLVIVTITLLLSATWIGAELLHFSQEIFKTFPELIK